MGEGGPYFEITRRALNVRETDFNLRVLKVVEGGQKSTCRAGARRYHAHTARQEVEL